MENLSITRCDLVELLTVEIWKEDLEDENRLWYCVGGIVVSLAALQEVDQGLIWTQDVAFSLIAQTVQHDASNAKVMGSIAISMPSNTSYFGWYYLPNPWNAS